MSKSLLQKRTRLLEGNSKNKKTRRTLKRKFNVQRNLRIVGCNANGLSSKLQSLDHIITQLQPGIILLQETKTKRIGKFNDIKGYTKFEMIRQQSGGGGLMTLVKPDLTPVFISEGNDEAEILTVEIHIDSMSIRVINCYGPQVIHPIQKKTSRASNFFTKVFGTFWSASFEGNTYIMGLFPFPPGLGSRRSQ